MRRYRRNLWKYGQDNFFYIDEKPIILYNEKEKMKLFIEHPENVQLYHLQQMREQLLGNHIHPSNGLTGTHTSWVMDQIIGNNFK